MFCTAIYFLKGQNSNNNDINNNKSAGFVLTGFKKSLKNNNDTFVAERHSFRGAIFHDIRYHTTSHKNWPQKHSAHKGIKIYFLKINL